MNKEEELKILEELRVYIIKEKIRCEEYLKEYPRKIEFINKKVIQLFPHDTTLETNTKKS